MFQRHREPLYKEDLLHQGGSDSQGSKSLSSMAEYNDATSNLDFRKDDWQVVRSKRLWSCTSPQVVSETHRQQGRCSLYLRKMKGLYFNCLAHDHMLHFVMSQQDVADVANSVTPP
jgi:hypothetical protein